MLCQTGHPLSAIKSSSLPSLSQLMLGTEVRVVLIVCEDRYKEIHLDQTGFYELSRTNFLFEVL